MSQSFLTSLELERFSKVYQPMGVSNALPMNFHGLTHAVSWFKLEQDRAIGYKLLDAAEALKSENSDILNDHFYWAARGKFYYRWREADKGALEEAVRCFERQTEMAPLAAAAFLRDLDSLPAHTGYNQLRIIYTKAKRFDDALALCERAKFQGWNADWGKHISALTKKAEKAE